MINETASAVARPPPASFAPASRCIHSDQSLSLNTIKTRIIAFATLATLIPAIALGVFSFWRYEAFISDNVTHELRVLVDYAGSEVAEWHKERIGELLAL